MTPKELDPVKISKLISYQVENVTCFECCKYYKTPETSFCGHTLCRYCWRSRRTCPICEAPLVRQKLKPNIPIKTLTENVCILVDKFEEIFSVKLDDFFMLNDVDAKNDDIKNVKDWLVSSQNHFSEPPSIPQQKPQEVHSKEKVSMSKIQVHTMKQIVLSPPKAIQAPLPQDDWDKIEPLLDTDDMHTKNKENINDPMDIEPFFIDEKEYTTVNPRRSSRKKELKTDSKNKTELSSDKPSSNKSSNETDKKLIISKQNWTNVKKMRKEFSKLNKMERNKLNVSIEMCKKTQSTINKANILTPVGSQISYIIEDNTPNISNNAKDKIRNNAELEIGTKNDNELNINKPKTSDAEIVKSQTGANTKIVVGNVQETDNIVEQKEKDTFPSSNQYNINKDTVENSIDMKMTKIPFFKIGSFQRDTNDKNTSINEIKNNNFVATGTNTDDIEITIKIGNTVTNIHIKKKENDVKFKLNTDREIQTSLGLNVLQNNSEIDTQNIEINVGNTVNKVITNKIDDKCIQTRDTDELNMENNVNKCVKPIDVLSKSISKKKNTDSADTATANVEITDSVEKELSHTMECVETKGSPNCIKNVRSEMIKSQSSHAKSHQNTAKNIQEAIEDVEYINDLRIFESDYVKENDVQLLKNTKYKPSEILASTVKINKLKSQKSRHKRDREVSEEDEENQTASKKLKTISEQSTENNQIPNDVTQVQSVIEHDSDYDAVLGQVFANIDADIRESQKVRKNTQNIQENDNTSSNVNAKESMNTQFTATTQNTQRNGALTPKIPENKLKTNDDQKYSESVFSLLDKENEHQQHDVPQIPGPETQKRIDNLLTPRMCQDLVSTQEESMLVDDVQVLEKELCTPLEDDDDKSVVEETPQKSLSFSKAKQKNDVPSNDDNKNDQITSNSRQQKNSNKNTTTQSQDIICINLVDSTSDKNDKECTVVENIKSPLETPLTINKFVDYITHKSTPIARKSLTFIKDLEAIDNDPDQTLCPTTPLVAKTTQEKEFMAKAFERTPVSPIKGVIISKNMPNLQTEKYCIAGSCLNDVQIARVKCLCLKYKWSFISKYEKSLTHLVVSADDENKSKRSVKYMCALAARKWIVSFAWIEKCLQSNEVVREEPFEVLDTTGHPGPMLSRLTEKKLFDGIVFYCMPPFSVFDVATLKDMLKDAGGCVVDDIEGVRIKPNGSPAFLLAEPEDTQEDRFLYLAIEQRIVPLNYEWVLNCLGCYSFTPVQELLLCPASIIPTETARWPGYLSPRDFD